ncbi:MAG: SDR family oxidoreductase [Anaerolineales bacterium]|jgi:NAD(P)-dependent dehydrogenase (short-subunit alcohol dehydrogenase family)
MNLTEPFNFADFNVVITGGAGVLGGEIACALVGAGANVAIIDRDSKRAEQLIERLGCWTGCAVIVYGDVLNKDTLEEAAGAITKEFGQVHALINAAGGNHPNATTSTELPFFDIPQDAFSATLDLNLVGTVLSCQVFGHEMAERGEGVILNISSMNAFRPLTRVPAYSAAKAAVSNFTQWLAVHIAQEYSPRIRVNAIAPGFFLTEQNRFLLTDKDTGELTPRGQAILSHTPMNRFGTPEDLLGATMWLLSPASAFVTGTVIPIDGGFSAFSGV